MNKLIIACLFVVAPLQAADALVKVVLGTASAKANSTLKSGTTFSTGRKSKAELAFPGGTVRAGSDTALQINAADAVQLHKGIALVSSKAKLFRGSVNVNTPGYGVKVRGTAQVYYDPGRSVRVVALEGEVAIELGSVRGEKLKLKRGQELIMNPTDRQLPTPVEVDLNRLMTTMALLDRTHFAPLPVAARLEVGAQRQQEELVHGEELDSTGIVMVSAAPELEIRPEEITHDEVSDEIDDLDGDGEPDPATTLDENGVPVEEDNADTANGDTVIEDNGGDTTEDGTRSVHRRPGITLRRASVSGNNVRIGNALKPARIQITNSSQVAAIAGALHVLGQGGSIAIDSSALRATREILIDASSTTAGLVSLRNATLNAEVIRARAYAESGDALVIDGSTLNANSLIKLYAEGVSTLRFRNQVTLNTNQAIIAGRTVEVDAGGTVNVRGKADVFTDSAHFNQTGYGSLNAGGGLTINPHAARPAF